MKPESKTPDKTAVPKPPRLAGDQLSGSRSTRSRHAKGSTSSQTLVTAKTTLPAVISGHQNIAAAVPMLGTGTSNS